MAGALAILVALPAILLVADHGLWNGTFPGLTGGLLVWAVGGLAIAAGARVGRHLSSPPMLRALAAPAPADRAAQPVASRGRVAHGILICLVLVSLAAFVAKVGGPLAYLRNLNNSAATTYGLTYLIWGMSFAKYGALAHLGESWADGRRPPLVTVGAAAVSLALLTFIGSRLLLLVALLQILLLYAALRPVSRRFKVALAGFAIIGAIVFVGLGELRRWESLGHGRSFGTYLAETALPQLPRTYVNNYADAVRLSVIARRVVPSQAGYEHGKEFLRVLLQPLPSGIRPKVPTARALTAAFTSGKRNGNALPVPVEGYLQFGVAGAIGLSLLLGVGVGLADRIGAAARDVGWLAATVAASTGAVIVMRGSLAQGVALATIEVVGFFAAHRLLYRPLTRAEVGVDSSAGSSEARHAPYAEPSRTMAI
jgi:hypothetical protein